MIVKPLRQSSETYFSAVERDALAPLRRVVLDTPYLSKDALGISPENFFNAATVIPALNMRR